MGFGFRDAIGNIVPPWLRGTNGEKYLYSMAVILDAISDAMVEGVRARIPGQLAEALPHIGRDRDIDRAPAETDAQYTVRLTEAFDTWRTAGIPRTILEQILINLAPLAPLVRTVSNTSVWHTLTGGVLTRVHAVPGNFNWSGTLVPWWRAWVIIYSPAGSPWTNEGTWGDGQVYGDGGTWGSTATASEVGRVRNIISKWKPAHAYVPFTIVSFTSGMFGPADAPGAVTQPDGTWGNWSKEVAGVQVPARSANAIYWSGV